MMAKWTHLFSSRTQKLSTSAATISRRALVKIARRQFLFEPCGSFFMSWFYTMAFLFDVYYRSINKKDLI